MDKWNSYNLPSKGADEAVQSGLNGCPSNEAQWIITDPFKIIVKAQKVSDNLKNPITHKIRAW